MVLFFGRLFSWAQGRLLVIVPKKRILATRLLCAHGFLFPFHPYPVRQDSSALVEKLGYLIGRRHAFQRWGAVTTSAVCTGLSS